MGTRVSSFQLISARLPDQLLCFSNIQS